MSRHGNRGGANYVLPPSRGACPTRKVQFSTRKQARAAAKAMHDSGLGVYDCVECEFWHVGHRPQRVRNGAIGKAAWLSVTTTAEGNP